jgi:hypothetical protein
VGLILGAFFLRALFVPPEGTGAYDWLVIHHNWEAARISISRYGEWPAWNPFFCGGITISGNPEDQTLSPFFWLSFLTGTTLAIKVMLVVHAGLGAWGMRELCVREYGTSQSAAWLAAIVWTFSGFFAFHFGGGHATFAPFYLAPWIVLACRAAFADVRFALALAGLFVLTLFEGGTYPLPYFALLVALEAGAALALRRNTARQVGSALVVAALSACLLGGVKLIPVIETLARFPRNVSSSDALELRELAEMLTSRTHEPKLEGHEYAWPEYAAYVGALSPWLMLLGLAFAWSRARRVVIVGSLLFGALTLGHFSPLSPWSLLHTLPVFSDLRVPSRFVVLFVFHAAVLCAFAIDGPLAFLEKRIPRLPLQALALVPLWLIASDLADAHFPVLERMKDPPISSDAPHPRIYQTDVYRDYRYFPSLPQRGIACRVCYFGNMSFRGSRAIWFGDVPQVRTIHEAARAVELSRTQHTWTLEIDSPVETTLLLNHNYDPFFRADRGQIVNHEGLLGVRIPPSNATLRLWYAPWPLYLGACTSLVGLVLSVFFLRARTTLRPTSSV